MNNVYYVNGRPYIDGFPLATKRPSACTQNNTTPKRDTSYSFTPSPKQDTSYSFTPSPKRDTSYSFTPSPKRDTSYSFMPPTIGPRSHESKDFVNMTNQTDGWVFYTN